MRKIVITLALIIILASFSSAEIFINEPPKDIYNLGNIIVFPVKVTTSVDKNSVLNIELICNGIETEVYKEYIFLKSGEEAERTPSIPLIKSFIGESTGNCKIKTSFGSETKLTDEFKISDLIKIELKTNKTTFNPGEKIIIETESKREDNESVNGFVEVNINGLPINITDTVKNGYSSLNIPISEKAGAGQYPVSIKVYEKDDKGGITNKGFTGYDIEINQIPTNLEILFEKKEVDPGTDVKISTILHDQTGEKISAKSIVTIKKDGEILKQTELGDGEELQYPIKYNEKPGEWEVIALSRKIKGSSRFTIIEKEYMEMDIINSTLIIKNKGNVPYNETMEINIGEEVIYLDLFLEVDEIKKYSLNAPEGRYDIKVSAGEDELTKSILLTGDTVSIKEKKSSIEIITNPLVWLFIIAILAFVSFIIFKRGYKKSFFGYIHKGKERKKPEKEEEKEIKGKKAFVNPGNKAELSLSIRGEKQGISLVCIKIKNLGSILKKTGKSSEEKMARETLQNITDLAEKEKAVTYVNNDCVFFLLIPIKTKTFNNEKTAISIAQIAEEIIKKHNKIYRQKIEFGISLNYGTIIAKQEKDVLKFMSMGTLITGAKKIASYAEEEILLGEKIKERIGANIKTEKHQKEKINVYKIKEIRDREKHNKFIRNFLDRLEKEKPKDNS